MTPAEAAAANSSSVPRRCTACRLRPAANARRRCRARNEVLARVQRAWSTAMCQSWHRGELFATSEFAHAIRRPEPTAGASRKGRSIALRTFGARVRYHASSNARVTLLDRVHEVPIFPIAIASTSTSTSTRRTLAAAVSSSCRRSDPTRPTCVPPNAPGIDAPRLAPMGLHWAPISHVVTGSSTRADRHFRSVKARWGLTRYSQTRTRRHALRYRRSVVSWSGLQRLIALGTPEHRLNSDVPGRAGRTFRSRHSPARWLSPTRAAALGQGLLGFGQVPVTGRLAQV